ncbi:S-methyl-5'-thioinosine phosphorylase [Acidiferrobacter sp.]|uniref:S-methyl-5'-thioinosine phosphorylase n=1 Tax=Acidiferrobacter sp. TaxID=1872107 RepID=UPI00263636DC|nr:S-methyl-5'-thioinosine phosphorylase [Acidiferrobacter sp.]
MKLLAIIGGSGLTHLRNLTVRERRVMRTPYGEPSAPMVFGLVGEHAVVFLPRHGHGHTIAPHSVNYQANIWALRECGVSHVIAVNAVGAINTALAPGTLVLPDQIIDYTHGRAHTFFGSHPEPVTHIDFTDPYCEALRAALRDGAARAGIALAAQGTYAATQGPRFETAAEIRKFERDGADIVGMTGMPEAALARELDLCYASLAVVANYAAGKADDAIDLHAIERYLESGMAQARTLLEHAIPRLHGE